MISCWSTMRRARTSRIDDLDQLLERGRNDPVGAVLAAPVRDTLKRAGSDGGIDGTEPRERLWRALTPQLFRRLQLTRALEAATRPATPSPTKRWRWSGRACARCWSKAARTTSR